MSFQPSNRLLNETDQLSIRNRSSYPSTVDKREHFQSLVYYYLNELRSFLSQSSSEIQATISEDMIINLANVLAEGKVFGLVSELAESQRMEERNLHKELLDLRAEQSSARSALRRVHSEQIAMNSSKLHHLPVLQREHELEMQRLNKRHSEMLRNLSSRILDALDGRLLEQQTALERLGVPGFVRTTNPNIIRIQMRILDWIVRLSRRPPGP